jgi:hypothetical protein
MMVQQEQQNKKQHFAADVNFSGAHSAILFDLVN